MQEGAQDQERDLEGRVPSWRYRASSRRWRWGLQAIRCYCQCQPLSLSHRCHPGPSSLRNTTPLATLAPLQTMLCCKHMSFNVKPQNGALWASKFGSAELCPMFWSADKLSRCWRTLALGGPRMGPERLAKGQRSQNYAIRAEWAAYVFYCTTFPG